MHQRLNYTQSLNISKLLSNTILHSYHKHHCNLKLSIRLLYKIAYDCSKSDLKLVINIILKITSAIIKSIYFNRNLY